MKSAEIRIDVLFSEQMEYMIKQKFYEFINSLPSEFDPQNLEITALDLDTLTPSTLEIIEFNN